MAGPELNIPVSVNLDKFRRGMAEAGAQTERTASGIENAFKQLNPDASGVFDRFTKDASSGARDAGNNLGLIIATGLTAAMAGVVTGLVATIGHLSKFGDLAEELRLPVNVMQALNVAMTEARVPAETFTKAMEHFSAASKKGGTDAEKLDEALTRIGPAFQKAFENAPTQGERLRVVADALKSTDNETKRAQLSLQMFGTENTRFISVLANGRDGIQQLIDRMRDLGLTVDEVLVKEAQKAKSEINLLSEVMGNKMAPALASVYRSILPLLGPLEKLALLVSSTIGVLHSVDDTKPMDTLTFELESLNRQADQLRQTRDELAKGFTSPADTLRDRLRKMIGIDVPVNEEIQSLDGEIQRIQDRIKTIDRIMADRMGGKPGGGNEPPAFKRRDPLGATASRDRFDSAADSIEKRTAAMDAENKNIDLGTEARNRARIAAELETVAKQINKEAGLGANVVTVEQRKRIDELAEAYGRVAVAIERSRSPLATFARESADLERQFNQFAASGLNTVTNDLADVVTGTKSVQDAFKSMTSSVLRDLARIAIRSALTGPIAGALGGVFGFGAGAAPGMPGSAFYGPVAPGNNAAGTDNWRGGPTWVGERGPEVVNLPRGAQVIPNDMVKNMGGGVSIASSPSIVINGPGVTMSEVQMALSQSNNEVVKQIHRALPGRMSRLQKLGT